MTYGWIIGFLNPNSPSNSCFPTCSTSARWSTSKFSQKIGPIHYNKTEKKTGDSDSQPSSWVLSVSIPKLTSQQMKSGANKTHVFDTVQFQKPMIFFP